MSSADKRAAPRAGAALLSLLSVTSALSPFAMVVVAPTLAALATQFDVGSAQIQFLVSAYLLGLGTAQPISGILCDRLGRRPVLLGGFALFIVASLVCAFVDRLDVLVVMRFLQAAGASVGTVTGRAVVRDIHDTEGSARALSYIAAAMGLSPIIAPALGGYIGAAAGPQAVFLASATFGAIIWWWALLKYPETADPSSRTHPTLAEWLESYMQLVRSRVFIGYSMMFGLAQAVFFAFLAVGATVFERDLGLGPAAFGTTWGALAAAYVAGATLAARLTPAVGMRRLLKIGLVLILCGAWAMPWLIAGFGVTFWTLTGPLALLSAANGVVTPLSLAGAVSYRPLIAGSSSGLSSAIGLTLSGLCTIVAGSIYTGSFAPVAWAMAVVGTLTAFTGWLTRRETSAAVN